MVCKKVQFLIILFGSVKQATQSIAGLTYMDDFDFEQRYRDVTECDPLYWYPLHLPPHCLKLYGDLIQKGISSNVPLRVVQEKRNMVYSLEPEDVYSHVSFDEVVEPRRHLHPHEKMFRMLRKDVKKDPSSPEITVIPGLGTVALYKQPISRKSGRYFKRISGAYRDANMKYNRYYFKYFNSTENPDTKDDKTNENKDYVDEENIVSKIKNIFGS